MTAYVYTSGGFPASPVSGDTLVINTALYDWSGAAWKARSTASAAPVRSEFTATANQATKTGLSYTVGSVDCYINGAKMLLGSDFTATNGTSVTFTPALDLNDEVQLIMGANASVASTAAAPTGTTLPAVGAAGSFFFKTDDTDLYVSNGTAWEKITSTIAAAAVSATGGVETTVGSYKYHTFNSTGSFVITVGGAIEYLIVAGGGAGGGFGQAGGGGAGGLLDSGLTAIAGTFPIVIGAGAVGGAGVAGTAGNNSTAFSLTAIGGGGGGTHQNTYGAATAGGSGGGAGTSGTEGASTTGQGYAGGGSGTYATVFSGGGGGGSSAIGGTGGNVYGNGGGGTNWKSLGTSYAGGGGGGSYDGTHATNGHSGGGSGGYGNSTTTNIGMTSATANTGSGGGGAGGYLGTNTGGNGGSGIVIIRYAI